MKLRAVDFLLLVLYVAATQNPGHLTSISAEMTMALDFSARLALCRHSS